MENNNSISRDSGYVNVDRGKLYYEVAGKGENLVLLHDGIVPSGIWDEQFFVFAKDYRVVRYDRRTYGRSSAAVAPYSHIEDLNQLFVQLKIEKAVVFGMSSGGKLAIDFTLKYPAKVQGLVLVGAIVSGYGYSSHLLSRGGRIDQSHYSDPQKMLKYIFDEDPYEIYQENVHAKEKIRKIFGGNPQLNRENGFEALPPDRPAFKFLSEIKIPALILAGEFDIPDVHAQAGVINVGIENSKREIIPNSGHLIPIEQPGLFNDAVISFLSELFTGL
ncbi:MAG: alpha/beta fold hydrolase [Tenuifilaceae bacterium]